MANAEGSTPGRSSKAMLISELMGYWQATRSFPREGFVYVPDLCLVLRRTGMSPPRAARAIVAESAELRNERRDRLYYCPLRASRLQDANTT